jgi:hypothetical protein
MFDQKKRAISVFHLIASFSSTDSGKIIEHIYGFLMVVERILKKYDEKNSARKSE